jgi:Leucine Rich Repeat
LVSLTADHLPNLSGKYIPAEVFRLTSLKSLSMAGCGLTGEISPLAGQLSNLQALYLYDNELQGSLPGDALGLRHLSLEKNSLTGELPTQFSDLAHLWALSLQDQKGLRGCWTYW